MVNLVMVCVGTVCVHEVFVGDNNYLLHSLGRSK